MSKKIIAVNAGPRKGWNMDTLIMEAASVTKSLGSSQRRIVHDAVQVENDLKYGS